MEGVGFESLSCDFKKFSLRAITAGNDVIFTGQMRGTNQWTQIPSQIQLGSVSGSIIDLVSLRQGNLFITGTRFVCEYLVVVESWIRVFEQLEGCTFVSETIAWLNVVGAAIQ